MDLPNKKKVMITYEDRWRRHLLLFRRGRRRFDHQRRNRPVTIIIENNKLHKNLKKMTIRWQRLVINGYLFKIV